MWQSCLACRSESHCSGCTFNQGCSEIAFHFADALTKQWLGDPEAVGGSGEMKFFCQRYEGFIPFHVHAVQGLSFQFINYMHEISEVSSWTDLFVARTIGVCKSNHTSVRQADVDNSAYRHLRFTS
jgi:hypothetical protein